MMEDIKLEEAVQRVQKMEQYLDDILTVAHEDSRNIWENEQLKEKWEKLLDYYTNGLWLSDYERDERGELPKDLKRGVLAQDTVYNLITEIEQDSDFCPYCGVKVSKEFEFCHKCGKKKLP